MRRLILPMVIASLPLLAVAEGYSTSPMVVISNGEMSAQQAADSKPAAGTQAATPRNSAPMPAAAFPNFPEAAITRVGTNTGGAEGANPDNPKPAPTPAAAPAAPMPVTPASPPTPKSPISKLWPKDTIQIFMPPCTGLRPQFVVPCTCTITRLMAEMPHDEFLAESEAGTIEQDPRLQRIRLDCATSPKKKE